MSRIICPALLAARASVAVGGVTACGDQHGGIVYGDPTRAHGIECVGSACAKWVPELEYRSYMVRNETVDGWATRIAWAARDAPFVGKEKRVREPWGRRPDAPVGDHPDNGWYESGVGWCSDNPHRPYDDPAGPEPKSEPDPLAALDELATQLGASLLLESDADGHIVTLHYNLTGEPETARGTGATRAEAAAMCLAACPTPATIGSKS